MIRPAAITGLCAVWAWTATVQPAAADELTAGGRTAVDSGSENERAEQQPGLDDREDAQATGRHPGQDAVDAVVQALDDIGPLAVIRPEAIGTDASLNEMEDWLVTALNTARGGGIIEPDEVIRCAGVEFTASPEGVAAVAKRCQAEAALFLRLIHSSEGTELYPLLVDVRGRVLLDRTFAIRDLSAVASGPVSPPTRAPADADLPPPEALTAPSETPAEWTPREAYARKRLAVVGRTVFADPDTPGDNWTLIRGGQPIGELDLVQLAGRKDLQARLEREIDSLRFRRNLGIGLTLGGFVAAGLSTPLSKSTDDTGVLVGGVIGGLGLAAGIAGAVLWSLYGERALTAGGAEARAHLLERQQVEALVREHNQALRRELGLPGEGESASARGSLRWYASPRAHAGLGFGVVVGF